jgi:GT2 family glycosyltransferase
MKIGIGILTYNRNEILSNLLSSISKFCTYDYLLVSNDAHDNVGVAGNSNRLIKGLYDLECDYFFILNDDVIATGDFPLSYIQAHFDTKIDMLCFRKWPGSPHDRETKTKLNNTDLTILHRITGNMIFFTRPLVDKIGYFDTKYGKFSEEHVDYTKRANLAGAFKVKVPLDSELDITNSTTVLDFQKTDTSMSDNARKMWTPIASMYHMLKWSNKIPELYCKYNERFE